jgi:PAS domain S-box-containing protein
MNRKCIKIVGKSSCFIVDLRKKIDLKLPTGISIFLNSKDLVCIANINGTYHKVNPAFTTVLGYSKEELESIIFCRFYSLKICETPKKLRTRGHKRLVLNRYRCKMGAFVLLLNVSPDPETGNLYCIARDVTLNEVNKK